MQLIIPYEQLSLLAYEGAGNRTPVLDLSSVEHITTHTPDSVRQYLEHDMTFREWLAREGKAMQADSVMLYYSVQQGTIDFITFIGEPNAALRNAFSTMCGNGIRALALHILLTTTSKEQRRKYVTEGIRIWAGSERSVFTESIDLRNRSGVFRVDMGPFVSTQSHFTEFLTPGVVSTQDLSSLTLPNAFIPQALWQKKVGLGFNGKESGEPHLVILYDRAELGALCDYFSVDSENITYALRKIVSVLGALTFSYELFPKGINVNVGVVSGNAIYMATHERNLLPSREFCAEQQRVRQVCQCNTMACGTGGAVVANIAIKQQIITSKTIETIHPGGTLQYVVSGDTTMMIGQAEKLFSSEGGAVYAET